MEELERSLGTMRRGVDAAWIAQFPPGAAETVAAAALRHGLATHARDARWVRAGLLMSYWIGYSDFLGRTADLVDKVLRGGDPAGIPFEQPDKTEFTLNRATAAGLGIALGSDILLRATEVVG
jgi:putative ABC transport system substrate-binding protein